MSKNVAKQRLSLKEAGLMALLAMGSAMLSGCECDGDCNVPVTTASTGGAATPTPSPTPSPTPTPAPAPIACPDSQRFCKMNSNGDILPDSATSWTCVQENRPKAGGGVDRFFWEVKTDDNGLRDKDWLYAKTGTNAAGACGSGTAPATAGCSVASYIAAVNAGTRPCGSTRTCDLPKHRDLIYMALPSSVFTSGGTIPSAKYSPPAAYFPEVMSPPYSYITDMGCFPWSVECQVRYDVTTLTGRTLNDISLDMAASTTSNMSGYLRLQCE